MVHKATSLLKFVLKHLIASLVSIAVPAMALLIVCVALFVIAVISNSGLGSPVALPLWMIFIISLSVLYTAMLLFPSTLIAEILVRAFHKWNHIAQIPISTLILFSLVYALSWIVRRYPHYSELNLLHWADSPFVVFLILTIPLGIYWWAMKIVQAGISLPIVLLRRVRHMG